MLLIRTKPDAVLSSVCPYPRKEWVKIVIIDQAYGPVRVLKHRETGVSCGTKRAAEFPPVDLHHRWSNPPAPPPKKGMTIF